MNMFTTTHRKTIAFFVSVVMVCANINTASAHTESHGKKLALVDAQGNSLEYIPSDEVLELLTKEESEHAQNNPYSDTPPIIANEALDGATSPEPAKRSVAIEYANATDAAGLSSAADALAHEKLRRIRNIIIVGNRRISLSSLLSRLPWQAGELYNPRKSSKLIRNLFKLGYFRQIILRTNDVEEQEIDLYLVIEEKRKLEKIVFRGNKHLTEADIRKKVDFSNVTAVDEEELKKFAEVIKKLYQEKNYHFVDIDTYLEGDGSAAVAVFDITENQQALVKRIFFEGNCSISAKHLKTLLFTREDWILGPFDKAGTYHPDAIEMDKMTIENYYQNNGFLTAKVGIVDVDINRDACTIDVTFHIQEGPQYTIGKVKIPGNELLSQETLECLSPIRPGRLYCREHIRAAIEQLRLLWGEYGYINADVDPLILPNEKTLTVDVTLNSELGDKVFLNRINIIGNNKTFDNVIRRQLDLIEGDILTTQRMDRSKNRVELLGYFDPKEGVAWKINRISEDQADLDLIVKEIKTGKANLKLGFGGSQRDITDPTDSLSLGGVFSDSNLFGRGILLNISGDVAKTTQTGLFNITNPWTFNRPITSGIDVYIRQSIYEDLRNVSTEAAERLTGGALNLGFISQKVAAMQVAFQLGFESIQFGNRLNASQGIADVAGRVEYQSFLNRNFKNGDFVYLQNILTQDLRNHPIHPSMGSRWELTNKVALPGPESTFSFYKFTFDASWYTPLIAPSQLILCLHGFIGFITPLGDKCIPYRELFHIGGPASVRGFTFGQIGPTWRGDSLGGTKAFYINTELIFPITADFSMKGAFFYDGGAGWDTPPGSSSQFVTNNKFDFRHAVGFGLRMLNPTPIKIDWGFKLDKRRGEKISEVHFSAYHEF